MKHGIGNSLNGLEQAPSAAGVDAAASGLEGVLATTPVLESRTLDDAVGLRCFLKAENLQMTGAFKVRGAFTALRSLEGRGKAQVMTASAGNFGQGVAWSAARLGWRARVLVPRGTPKLKIQRIERYGGEVIVDGDTFDDSDRLARQAAARAGAAFLPPFDHGRVIEGQGTVAAELLAQVPDLDTLVVPCGGGGLAAGVVLAARATGRRIRIVAVEPSSLPSLTCALQRGAPCCLPPSRTMADGIAVRRVGELPFRILRDSVDQVIAVSEAEIARAIVFLALELKQVVEGAGAAALAAVLARREWLAGSRKVGVLITGGNIDPDTMARTLVPSPAMASGPALDPRTLRLARGDQPPAPQAASREADRGSL